MMCFGDASNSEITLSTKTQIDWDVGWSLKIAMPIARRERRGHAAPPSLGAAASAAIAMHSTCTSHPSDRVRRSMYARNLTTFVKHLAPEGELVLDLEDEITSGAMLTHEGEITNERVRHLAAGGD